MNLSFLLSRWWIAVVGVHLVSLSSALGSAHFSFSKIVTEPSAVLRAEYVLVDHAAVNIEQLCWVRQRQNGRSLVIGQWRQVLKSKGRCIGNWCELYGVIPRTDGMDRNGFQDIWIGLIWFNVDETYDRN
jgi:hypothetical protein